MAKRFFALNAPPTECLCCNHVCRQRSNSGEQACSGMPYPRISPRFPPFSPVFPHFPPFFPIFPHFSHFSVAQRRLGDSGVGDFQGLAFASPPPPPRPPEGVWGNEPGLRAGGGLSSKHTPPRWFPPRDTWSVASNGMRRSPCACVPEGGAGGGRFAVVVEGLYLGICILRPGVPSHP